MGHLSLKYSVTLLVGTLVGVSLGTAPAFGAAKPGDGGRKDSALEQTIARDIEKIIKTSKVGPAGLGIAIGDPVRGKILFEKNARSPLIPASVTKVITGASVFRLFPPGTKVKTELVSEAAIEGDTLKGDLCLRGGGDPGFVSESMWFLVNAFKRTGVVTVSGDVLVDSSLFDEARFDESRQKERVDRAYDAPVSAMSFNWNSVNVFIRPAAKAGEPALVTIDPENDYVKLTGKVMTSAGAGNEVMVDRRGGKDGDTVTVGGKIGVNAKEVVVYKNITNPDQWAGANLKSFLAQRGIGVKGGVRSGRCGANMKVLAESESQPIERMLADMNKFSNNYVAEMLTKLMASTEKKPATIAQGMKMIHDFTGSLGLPDEQVKLVNPSGLTRENRLSAFALMRVLENLQKDFRLMPELFVSLPIAGVDGTLKKRMKNSPGERWVRAKTGYLDGVVSLAGYAGNGQGRVFPFAMIYNGPADEGKVRATFDRMVLSLIANALNGKSEDFSEAEVSAE